ncbi:Hypothetical predicted protein, partial [Drosophila guanche]
IKNFDPTKPGLELDASAYVIPELARNIPLHSIAQSLLTDLPSLPLADPTFFNSSPIDVLIGADILPSVVLSGVQPIKCSSLFGQETIF